MDGSVSNNSNPSPPTKSNPNTQGAGSTGNDSQINQPNNLHASKTPKKIGQPSSVAPGDTLQNKSVDSSDVKGFENQQKSVVSQNFTQFQPVNNSQQIPQQTMPTGINNPIPNFNNMSALSNQTVPMSTGIQVNPIPGMGGGLNCASNGISIPNQTNNNFTQFAPSGPMDATTQAGSIPPEITQASGDGTRPEEVAKNKQNEPIEIDKNDDEQHVDYDVDDFIQDDAATVDVGALKKDLQKDLDKLKTLERLDQTQITNIIAELKGFAGICNEINELYTEITKSINENSGKLTKVLTDFNEGFPNGRCNITKEDDLKKVFNIINTLQEINKDDKKIQNIRDALKAQHTGLKKLWDDFCDKLNIKSLKTNTGKKIDQVNKQLNSLEDTIQTYNKSYQDIRKHIALPIFKGIAGCVMQDDDIQSKNNQYVVNLFAQALLYAFSAVSFNQDVTLKNTLKNNIKDHMNSNEICNWSDNQWENFYNTLLECKNDPNTLTKKITNYL